MLYGFFRALFRGYFQVFHRWQVSGAENVPQNGAVIIAANHISNLDPPLVGSGCRRKVNFMAKAELFKIPVLGWLIRDFGAFPVRRGAGDRAALRTVFKLLDEGQVLGLFPEGTRSKSGEVEEGQSGAATFALRSGATVVPAAIIGPVKLFKPLRLVYGKPVDLSRFQGVKANKEIIAEATEEIMNAIETLIEEHRHR
ncbi:lysophospholipid acyltransferase family protein [Tumebacillus sp. DT12]|uniref:1-acyl-sn-glycerol-3-phosphate acyltransferase n=1 Tax=Tumebacillus lacus TaxID=2995335 RepID=A0ABT3WZL0_9BACL|nr:lysophospholipid acyltransferase family protein [Tumebacillus lacus]MCX7568957.1 lysophospholipid acyltransferase family protein [Tumebacillus lacus]